MTEPETRRDPLRTVLETIAAVSTDHGSRALARSALASSTPDALDGLTGDTDDLMQRLATESDPRFADTAGRAYIRIRTLQAALAARGQQ